MPPSLVSLVSLASLFFCAHDADVLLLRIVLHVFIVEGFGILHVFGGI